MEVNPMLLNPVPPKGKERASTKVEKHLARMQRQRDTMDALVVMQRTDQYALITTLRAAAKHRREDPVQRVAMCVCVAVASRCIHSRKHMLPRCQNPMNDYLMQMLVQNIVLMQLCLNCSVVQLALALLYDKWALRS
jgi:hypothetical protein